MECKKGLDTKSFIIFIDETCNLEVMMTIRVRSVQSTYVSYIHSFFMKIQLSKASIIPLVTSVEEFSDIREINEKFNANLLSTMNNANGCRSRKCCSIDSQKWSWSARFRAGAHQNRFFHRKMSADPMGHHDGNSSNCH